LPEGDTIFGLAERLRPTLLGRALTDVWLREVSGADRLEGRVVTAVRAWGKHLLIETDGPGAPILRSHLGMNGSWHTARTGSRRQPSLRVAFRAGARGPELRCIDAAQVEVFAARDLRRHPALSRLGPDLLAEHSLDEIVLRARGREHGEVGQMLLDQCVAAGLGNVYKSEILFRAGLHPWTCPSALDDGQLSALYADGARLLSANARRSRRVTTLGPLGARARVRGIDHFVYGRAGQACVTCGTRIAVRAQGEGARPTFLCAVCQPPREQDPSVAALRSHER